MKQFICKSMVVCLNWGVVGDGRRPILNSEMNGHVTLPPFLIFSCLNMHPPSVRGNASMAFACGFVKLGLWNEFVHIWLPF